MVIIVWWDVWEVLRRFVMIGGNWINIVGISERDFGSKIGMRRDEIWEGMWWIVSRKDNINEWVR